jgi:hypothetical protein
MAAIGCGICHKGTKHTDKCNNKTKTTQKISRNKMTKPQTNTFSKYCEDNTKMFDINYMHTIQDPYNKQ